VSFGRHTIFIKHFSDAAASSLRSPCFELFVESFSIFCSFEEPLKIRKGWRW